MQISFKSVGIRKWADGRYICDASVIISGAGEYHLGTPTLSAELIEAIKREVCEQAEQQLTQAA